MKNLLILAFACFLLAACGGGSQSPAQAGLADAILVAECKMYEVAYVATKQQKGSASAGILRGCPNTPETATGGALGASGANLSSQFGKRGVEMYRKMIARGVPSDVAAQVTGSPDFAKTVELYNQYDAS